METSPVSVKMTLYAGLVSAALLILLFISSSLDSRTTVVFCDVGQGDGMYMRIKNKIDVVVDAGPDNSIIECLGKHMPFFDRTIEMAFITHPQKDHYYGFISIGNRYTIKSLFMNPLSSDNESFKDLVKIIEKQNTTVFFPFEETNVKILESEFKFLWPSRKFIEENISQHTKTFSYQNTIKKNPLKKYMGTSKLDPNLFSLIFYYEEKPIRILLTGDTTGEILNKLLKKKEIKSTILKIPHHGSKNGLNADFLRLADPTISVISLGKKNRYGHPSQEIIKMLQNTRKNFVRTDQEGNIMFVLSGNFIERL